MLVKSTIRSDATNARLKKNTERSRQKHFLIIIIIIIIIMEICKAPTLRLKALNKHTHITYIEMKNVIQKKKKEKREKEEDIDKGL